jgi:hypothetical protein
MKKYLLSLLLLSACFNPALASNLSEEEPPKTSLIFKGHKKSIDGLIKTIKEEKKKESIVHLSLEFQNLRGGMSKLIQNALVLQSLT